MNEAAQRIGITFIYTGGILLLVVALSAICALAGKVSYFLFVQAMKGARVWKAWQQMKKTHRLFFAWAVKELKAGKPINDGFGRDLSRDELIAAFESYDPTNDFGWREAIGEAIAQK